MQLKQRGPARSRPLVDSGALLGGQSTIWHSKTAHDDHAKDMHATRESAIPRPKCTEFRGQERFASARQ